MSTDKVQDKTDVLLLDDSVNSTNLPEGWDRRAFMMRSAMIGAVAVLSGCAPPTPQQTAEQATSAPPIPPKIHLSPDLDVVKKTKGPVMTTIDEFYKVGPGPVELAHDRADADHLRLLPALHQAARRPARQGDRA